MKEFDLQSVAKILLILILTCLWSCNNSATIDYSYSGPLKKFFIDLDGLANDKYNLQEKNRQHTIAIGLNDKAAVDKALSEFKTAHQSIIDAMSLNYPLGSVQFPIEQSDLLPGKISNLRITQYQFPWETATRLSFILSFDYLKTMEKPMSLVRFEFYDNENDLFMSSNVSVEQSGTYSFEIRPEIEIFHFQKTLVTVY